MFPWQYLVGTVRGAIGADTDEYRSSCIIFRIFSWSWTQIVSNTHFSIPYSLREPLVGWSAERKLSASFAPLHRILDSRSAIREHTERLIAEISKEKRSVSSVYSDATTHLYVILFLSEVTTNFSHTTWYTNTYGWISLILYPILYFSSESELDTDSIGYPFLHLVFTPWAFGRSVGNYLLRLHL